MRPTAAVHCRRRPRRRFKAALTAATPPNTAAQQPLCYQWPRSANDMDGLQNVAELDLGACHPNSIADRISAVPGLKTSTAFFTFLRANLVLPPSAMSSNVSTPNLEPSNHSALPPPSPSPLGASSTPAALPAMDEIPPLSLDVLADRGQKVDALRLVADSIAQQRQRASLSLVFHPLGLAVLAAGLAVTHQYTWVRQRDLGMFLTLGSGVVMIYLLAIRYATARYIRLAEDFTWDWIAAPEEGGIGEEDTIIGTRFGDEMIGALVLRLEPPNSGNGTGNANGNGNGGSAATRSKKSRAASLRGGRGVIRAWTTKLRFRRRGVGADMLHEAVRVTRERCGKDAEVGFAKEHANSAMVLPEMFNGAFRKQERKAAKALDGVLAEWEGNRRKR